MPTACSGVKPARSSLTVAQQGFDAWRRGDFDALEAIFASDVEWRWFEPGDWDCHSRDDVMRTLRQRHAAGFAEGRLTFHEGKVVSMQDYRTEAEAPPPQNEAADHRYLQA